MAERPDAQAECESCQGIQVLYPAPDCIPTLCECAMSGIIQGDDMLDEFALPRATLVVERQNLIIELVTLLHNLCGKCPGPTTVGFAPAGSPGVYSFVLTQSQEKFSLPAFQDQVRQQVSYSLASLGTLNLPTVLNLPALTGTSAPSSSLDDCPAPQELANAGDVGLSLTDFEHLREGEAGSPVASTDRGHMSDDGDVPISVDSTCQIW